MQYGRALWAGIIGALAVTILTAVARSLGLAIDFELMLGTLVGVPPGAGAWLLGFLIHLVHGATFGLVYAWGFEALRRGGWVVGAGFGIVHALVAGSALALILAVHPFIPEPMPAPGPFLSSLGAIGVAVDLGLHMTYGVIVGLVYGPPGATGMGMGVSADRPRAGSHRAA